MGFTGRDGISETDIREELSRIVSSKIFSRSERMKRFLSYTVEQSLLNSDSSVKEYTIAVAVYDKPDSFDPRIDPIVRVEASRLRAKLREYYGNEGRSDSVIISIRKKGYSAVYSKRKPDFVPRSALALAPEVEPSATGSPEAQDFYLKGRYYWNKRHPQAVANAIECFKGALSIDSGYAHAHAGLADCYATQAWLEVDSPGPLWQAAEAAARKALEIDESLAPAITTLACRQALYDWDWIAAEASFRDALARDPRYPTARHWYGIYCLAPQRRLNAALNEIAKACEMDPVSSVIGTHLGFILYFRRQFREAIEQYERAIEIDPVFPLTYWHLGFAYTQHSRFQDALRVLNQARELGHGAPAITTAIGFVYASMNRKKDAERMLQELESLAAATYVSPTNFALIHTALNDRDAALHWLERARDERAARIVHLKVEPGFDRLKTSPRFLTILSSLNLL